MTTQTHCQTLSARFERMAQEGLLDVKFYVKQSDEVTLESLCEEVEALYAAVERGEVQPLDFKDSYRQ